MGRDLTIIYTYYMKYIFWYKKTTFAQVTNSGENWIGKRIKKIFYFDLTKLECKYPYITNLGR